MGDLWTDNATSNKHPYDVGEKMKVSNNSNRIEWCGKEVVVSKELNGDYDYRIEDPETGDATIVQAWELKELNDSEENNE